MRNIAVITACALVLGLLAGCGGGNNSTQPAYGTLRGYLYTETRTTGDFLVASGAPRTDIAALVGAAIEVDGYAGLTATTDAAGFFQLDNVPTGTRNLIITEGVPRTTLTVNVLADTITTVNQAKGLVKAKWTVLVYMAADNNLEADAIDDVNEMERVVDPNSPVNVVVQLDRSTGYDNSNGDWHGARRYEIRRDPSVADREIRSREVERLTDNTQFNMGNWEHLHDFISWGQEMYPAEQYMVVLWNHGNGWHPNYDRPTTLPAGAIAFDDGSWSWIRDGDLPKALDVPQRVAVVAADACLMGMLEVAYELRNSADYYVASTANVPGEGYNYTSILGELIQSGGTLTPRALAQEIPKEAIAAWPYANYTTSSAIDLAKIADVAAATDMVAKRLTTVAPAHTEAIRTAWSDVLYHDSGLNYKLADLGHYATLINEIPDDSLRSAVATLQTALGEAVIANHYRTSLPSSGLSIYLTTAAGFDASTQQSYNGMAFSTYHWDEWLMGQPSL